MITAAASSSAAPATSVCSISSFGSSPWPTSQACVASQISVPAVKMSSAAPKMTSAGASKGRAIAQSSSYPQGAPTLGCPGSL
jgi:hypothetical protein